MVCSAQDLITQAACFNGLPPQQLQVIMVAQLCAILQARNPMASCDPQELLEAGACFAGLDRAQLTVIQTQLLCEILHSGSGGESCLYCGNSDPAGTPACDCALAYNKLTGAFFYWDADTTAWVQLVGGPGA